MAENSSRTLVCSVLFIDIVEYSRKAVFEQQRVKEAFNRLLSSALEQVAPRDRVILDTGDGAAVTFFGDPEDALFVALAIRDSVGSLPVRMGVNLGPVRLVTDLNGQVNIVGDGINVAQRVMSFSQPGQLLVSRSFYEVVSCLADNYAALFRREGLRTDKHVREHEVYSVAEGADAGRGAAKAQPPAGKPHRAGPHAFDLSRLGGRSAGHISGDTAARQPVLVHDAGSNVIISGYSKSSVEEELGSFIGKGYRALSPVAQVGSRWMASCEHPTASVSACRVEELGFTRIVTGPSQEAVSAKVAELVQFGSVLVSNIECADGVWTAVCDTSGYRGKPP